MYLFYNYYRKGRWERAPYFHMLVSMTLLAFVNTVTILCFYSKSKWIFGNVSDYRIIKLLISFTAVMIILNLIGSQKMLNSLHYSKEKVKKGKLLLIAYVIISFGIMIGSMFVEKYYNRLEDVMPTKITPIDSDSL